MSIPPMVSKLHQEIQKSLNEGALDLTNWNNGRVFMQACKHQMVNGEVVLNVLDDIKSMHHDTGIDLNAWPEMKEIFDHFHIPLEELV